MNFQEWFNEKYKDTPEEFEVNLIDEIMEYNNYSINEGLARAMSMDGTTY